MPRSRAEFEAQLGIAHDVPAEQRRNAVRVIAANAHDVTDCAYLLGALGLDPKEGTDDTGLAPATP
jgi:hypothetical protein